MIDEKDVSIVWGDEVEVEPSKGNGQGSDRDAASPIPVPNAARWANWMCSAASRISSFWMQRRLENINMNELYVGRLRTLLSQSRFQFIALISL